MPEKEFLEILHWNFPVQISHVDFENDALKRESRRRVYEMVK